jgi:N-acetylglucosaminyl-diphospho-decaprenol L-rhamnosyltransferase
VLRYRSLVRVLVVVVNYRAAKLVVECLASLAGERERLPDLQVTVVDNPGGDDSLSQLDAAIDANGWRGWVTVRAMPRNGGFAYGVNAGVQPALQSASPPDAFLLLNPDTWVRAGAVVELVRFLAARPDVGIVGSRLEDPDGTVQHSRFRFPGIASDFEAGLSLGVVTKLLHKRVVCPPFVDEAHEIDWVSGACQLVRREVFERVGPFDEGYFLYFEELDFARRARAAGVRTWHVPQSRVVHLVGQTTGLGHRHGPQNRVPAYWFESRSRYLRKHHGRGYELVADMAFIVGKALWHCLRIARGRRDEGPPSLLRDFVRHSLFGRRARAT